MNFSTKVKVTFKSLAVPIILSRYQPCMDMADRVRKEAADIRDQVPVHEAISHL